MYRCKNKADIGDLVEIDVEIQVQETNCKRGDRGCVVAFPHTHGWVQVKTTDDRLIDVPSNWCVLLAKGQTNNESTV
jgi:hypothetical protein